MTHTLPKADWLTSEPTRAVMAALEKAKPRGSRFVGGCVRNTLMGRPVDDIDIATQLKPDEVITALEAAEIRALPTGIEHGTITAIVDHVPFEITSLRRDVETDGRRAVVAFTEDWAEDAARRDFRLNALYAEPNGALHDPTGGGLDDAADGRVVFIGDADERLREDYLRILRFFRFNAWYGAEIDAAGLAACARQKEGLGRIAAERIWKELKKLLAAPDPTVSVAAMRTSGVLDHILPETREEIDLQGLIDLEQQVDERPDPLRRLMRMVSRRPDTAVILARQLKWSNDEQGRFAAWGSASLDPTMFADTAATRRAIYQTGQATVIDWALSEGHDDIVRMVKAADPLPHFPLRGQDLVAAGLKPGPHIGAWLSDLENWWIESDFKASRIDVLEEFEARLKRD